ncbi:hypothetical protein MKK58_00640 [Methylobacterium sp. J-078]|uniref:hypothetical protein n=1 Tax=Methylobacterium sp. J-078 TaxID=2836657 RepID=UPI001FB91DE5|nr:hypothetical protein [Methylobacterium sp. J-078]MCJ2043063.1 hypothetical protein [Methylobacterium sp. J-078]
MDEAWKKARREELWNDVVLQAAREAGIATDAPRLEIAAKLLEIQRAEYEDALKRIDHDVPGDEFKVQLVLGKSRLTWQVMMLEAYGWFAESSPGESLYPQELLQNDVQGVARECFGYQLAASGILHHKGIDPVALMLPRWVAQAIADGFDGLAQGQTLPIFQAAPSTKKGDAYTWDKMRLRAVQHVAFLVGSGSTKKSAQNRVELATKIKAGTLRDWETDLKKGYLEKFQIEWARKAGELSVILEYNPKYAEADGNTIDVNVHAILLETQREPLSTFGLRYRSHNFDTRQT